jgi:lysophospholipase L1-like esterase
MKKVLSLLLILTMTVSLFSLAVSALLTSNRNEVQSMVVFGDSISTGYGLEGDVSTRASYANLVAEALDLRQGNGYVNYAVDGYTSKDIYNTVQQQSAAVADADLILLTCGGNDILKHAISIAISVSGVNTTDLIKIAMTILQMPAEQVNAALHSEANEQIISKALNEYRTNMESLVTYLKATAPDARVIFLTQYNPLSGIPFGTVLDLYAEEVIGRLNTIMSEVAEAGGCEIVDTHAVMVKRGLELSNILASDIHPNAAGHAEMAKMVKTYLGIPEQAVEQTTTLPTVTTTEPVMTTTLPVTEATTATTSVTTAQVTYATTTSATTQTAASTTAVLEVPVDTSGTVTESTSDSQASVTTSEEISSEEPTQSDTEQDSTAPWVVVVGASLLLVGIGGTVLAFVLRKKN